MTRRAWIALAGTGLLSAAKTRLARGRVAAITDEMAKTQSEAVQAAREYGFDSVELRNVPESGKPFASLSDPELKRWATELAANKLKVSVLHVPASASLMPAASLLSAAAVWTAGPDAAYSRVLVDAGRLADLTQPAIYGAWTPGSDWQEAWRRLPRARIATIRVPSATLDRQSPQRLGWKGILEMLQKDGYTGTLTVEKGGPDDIRELIHLIGQVA